MKRGNPESPSRGKLTSGIQRGDWLVQGTIQFIQTQLPRWRDDAARSPEESEPELNAQLCKYLDAQARGSFPMARFNHEEPQDARRHVDLSATPSERLFLGAKLYSIYEPFLVIECKRLPAPAKTREKEYLTGTGKEKSGGIQRFKLGLYASQDDCAVLVGYIQSGNTMGWRDKLNGWILDFAKEGAQSGCVWESKEQIRTVEEDTSAGLARCLSSHKRIGKVASDTIELYHLWIDMLKK